MNQTSLLSFIILFSSLLISTTLCSVNPKFLACEPNTCGNGPNITYPFYIDGKQEPYCGFPRFSLLCTPDGFPSLNLSNTLYIVREISYPNHSLRVSNSAFSSECISRAKNLTLYGERFNFPPNQKEVVLFFNCDVPEELREDGVGCSADNRTGSVLGFAMDDAEKKLRYATSSCRGGVMTTMVVEEEYRREGIGEAVKRGFELNWTVSECEACAMSGGRCGFDMDSYSFRCYCRDDGDQLSTCRENKSRVLKLGLGLGLGIGVPGLLAIGVIVWCYKRQYGNSEVQFRSRNGDIEDSEGSTGNVFFGVPVFSYEELQAATNIFHHSRELGDGGFGTVYYGKLQDGREVAVKRLYEQNYRRVEQFMNEVRILTCLRHKNLVSLYGCTSRRSRELILVYEYVSNGTVAYHLNLHRDPKKPTVLPWSTRMKIAVETASALAYLHASDIIHRDVKTNNILLDDGFNVKVADFGLSRLFPYNVTHVSTAPQGTPGYVDPEYHQSYQLTSKSDVYSFGVVLVELISSMAAVDMSRDREEINLSSLAMRRILRSELSELVDPSLGFETDGEVKRMVLSVSQLAFQCLQRDKELRPSMEEVLEALRRIQSGSDQLHQRPPLPPGSPNWDEVGLLKNDRLVPNSPISVGDKWESKSTTPNVSG